MPQFSVIIPAFNSAATLAETIESVLAQTFSDYETIVVNDGSLDDTEQVLQRYAGRINVFRQENRGLSGARNAGARVACGRWIALLDADDTWTPDKLQKVADAIPLHPEAVLFYSDATCFDTTGALSRGAFMPSHLAYPPSMDDMIACRFQILPSSAVIRRDLYDRIRGFSEEFHTVGFEDIHFWLRLREQGPFAYISERLVNYRVAPLLTRLEKYRPAFKVFKRLIREQYGHSGKQIIRARRKARVNLWARAGLEALAKGEVVQARHAFFGAFRENPWRIKNLLRTLRTYLPQSVARAVVRRTSKPYS